MPKEIVRLKAPNGYIFERERIFLSSDKPYITPSEHCLEKILDPKKIEKKYNIPSDNYNKEIDKTIKKIIRNEISTYMLGQLINLIEDTKQEEKINFILNYFENNLNKNKQINPHYYKLDKTPEKSLDKLKTIVNNSNNENITNQITSSLKKQHIKKSISEIKQLIKDMETNPSELKKMNYMVEIIKNAQKYEDLEKITNIIFEMQNDPNKKQNMTQFYSQYPELTLSFISKEIIKRKVKRMVSKYNQKELIHIEIERNSSKDLLDILLKTDNTFNKTSLENGVLGLTLRIFNDEFDKAFDNTQHVLCWNCTNGYPSRCEKIKDIEKKKIELYPFITSGSQIIKNDELYNFFIVECQNFDNKIHYKLLTEAEAKIAKQKLAALFYDTETVHEAEAIKKISKYIRKSYRR